MSAIRIEWASFASPAGQLCVVFVQDAGQVRNPAVDAIRAVRAMIMDRVSFKDGRRTVPASGGVLYVFPMHFWVGLDGIMNAPGVQWARVESIGQDAFAALFPDDAREKAEAEKRRREEEQERLGRRYTRTRVSYSSAWANGTFRVDRAAPGATSGSFRTENMDEFFASFRAAWAEMYDRPASPPAPPPPRRPAPAPPGPYAELGIAADADRTTARARYHQLAREHHPDAGGDAERMKRITAAWAQVRRQRDW